MLQKFHFNYSKANLREKILLGFLIILVIMLSISSWGIFNFYKINRSLNNTLNQNYSSIVAVDNMNKAIDEQLNGVLAIFEEDITKGKSQFDKSNSAFLFWYKKAIESAFTEQERTLLSDLQNDYQQLLKTISDLDSSKVYDTDPVHKKTYFKKTIGILKEMKSKSHGIFEVNHKYMNKLNSQVAVMSNTATVFMMFILVCGILVSFLFSTKFSNYLAKPIQELTKSAESISNGNFSSRIEITGNDEIGVLADKFNMMSEKLEKYEKLNLLKNLYEQKKSETIIESIHEPVLMTDTGLNLLSANSAFRSTFGDTIEGNNLRALIKDPEFIEHSSIEQGKEVFQIKQNMTLVVKITEGKRYFKLTHSAIKIPDSEIAGFVFIFNDITKYHELDKLKSEFLGKISHELKTPLTAVGMALGILEDGVFGQINDKQKYLVTSMKEDYERLNKLVHHILELTRIESGKVNLTLDAVSLVPLVEHVVKNFGLQSKEKQIELGYTAAKPLPPVKADYEYLLRAIENLIANALKFTEKGGKIHITLSAREEAAVITIADTGIGIDPRFIDKIFDKFVQVNDNLPGSVGLGLSIAKEIIELHKGTISVKSELGKGTIFEIQIPVAKA